MYLFYLLNYYNKKEHKRDMNFQNWTLWIVILTIQFYIDFEMVQSLMIFWLGIWFWLDNILKNLKFLYDGICKILSMDF
jgi:hypothetical protein